MITPLRKFKIQKAACADFQKGSARHVKNPMVAEIYNYVYGRLYEIQEQMSGVYSYG